MININRKDKDMLGSILSITVSVIIIVVSAYISIRAMLRNKQQPGK